MGKNFLTAANGGTRLDICTILILSVETHKRFYEKISRYIIFLYLRNVLLPSNFYAFVLELPALKFANHRLSGNSLKQMRAKVNF